jgi:penicillin-binding protein 1A
MKNAKKVAILLFVLVGIISGAIIGAFIAFTYDLPQIRSLETYRPSAITRVYSADKALLAELFAEKRDPVPLHIIPDYLKKGLLAVEDRKFYKHSGVDLKGVLRAAFQDIRAGKFVQGASTITQQLAKTLFLSSEKTFTRKIKEAILAFQFERRYTKDEILEMYLNQIYLGSGAYGAESAARIFFGKSVQNLSLSECALIAAMPRSPSRYSPFVNPRLALKRRNIVLDQMKQVDIITQYQCEEAKKEQLNIKKQDKDSIKAPYFIEYLKPFLLNITGPSTLYKRGLTVFTTLNFRLQQASEQALTKGLLALKLRMKQKRLPDPNPEGALVAIDVNTGEILAMTGGSDFKKTVFNRAADALRQPGSAFKPILYAHAIERGFPQNTTLLDAPIAFKTDQKNKDWKPENFSGTYKGEITLRMALAQSRNVPAVRLIEILGPNSVAGFSHTLGIKSPILPNLSVALGTCETRLMDLTAAYAVFPNQGLYIKPYGIVKILDNKSRTIWQAKPLKSVAMSREGAAIMVDMLKAAIQDGTGRKARVLNFPVAGKTGTTDDYKDALFIGFSPEIAVGVWVGEDNPVTLGQGETGAKAALPIWIHFMSKTVKHQAYQYFDIPDNMVRVFIDPLSGNPVDHDFQGADSALFRNTNAPQL